MDRTRPLTLYAVGFECVPSCDLVHQRVAVAYHTDDGVVWEKSEGPADDMFRSVAVDPRLRNHLYATTGESGIWETFDVREWRRVAAHPGGFLGQDDVLVDGDFVIVPGFVGRIGVYDWQSLGFPSVFGPRVSVIKE